MTPHQETPPPAEDATLTSDAVTLDDAAVVATALNQSEERAESPDASPELTTDEGVVMEEEKTEVA